MAAGAQQYPLESTARRRLRDRWRLGEGAEWGKTGENSSMSPIARRGRIIVDPDRRGTVSADAAVRALSVRRVHQSRSTTLAGT